MEGGGAEYLGSANIFYLCMAEHKNTINGSIKDGIFSKM